MANYMPTNKRSGNLLERLGFTVEGYAKDYLLINGSWRDHLLTSGTNPNWHHPEEI
jgi:ribosomal-protein-alanine N-acetyltransferase